MNSKKIRTFLRTARNNKTRVKRLGKGSEAVKTNEWRWSKGNTNFNDVVNGI